MPLVRIDLARETAPETRSGVGDVVYEAMLTTLNVPRDDRFQVIAAHEPGGLVFDNGYLGIERHRCIFIQVTLNEGRTVVQKRAFFAAVADGLHERFEVRREDVFISLVEVKKENWSFGNGEAQYAQ
ncbi:MAG: tautomerase family protein [Candidatus Velthaea sp.]